MARTDRPILMGEAPARSMPPGSMPFSSQSGRRLRELLEVDQLSDRFELRNLLHEWPGESGKGDAFPLAEATKMALGWLDHFQNRVVLFAGKRVARAFGARGDEPYFALGWRTNVVGTRGQSVAFKAAIIPHPSGVNRWYNDAGNRKTAREFFDELERQRWR